MVICAVVGCGNRTGRDNVRMFSIPAVITNQCAKTSLLSSRRRALWLTRINRADLTSENIGHHHRVCNKHFISGSPSRLFDETNPDWAPSLRLGHDVQRSDGKGQTAQRGHERASKRKAVGSVRESTANTGKRRKLPKESVGRSVHCQDSEVCYNFGYISKASVNVACQTDLTGEYLGNLEAKYENTLQDNIALREELCKLRDQLRLHSVDMDALAKDEKKLKFYTGLPSLTVVMHVFNFVPVQIMESHGSSLSKFQEFILVLMRLRLNLLEQDLAYRFGIGQSAVSAICDKWIRILSCRLGKLIVCPEREILQANMPESFKTAFGTSVAVIIDCLEVFTQRPSFPSTQAETLSDYKKHNTVKFLIEITPQGTVSFISRGWVGGASVEVMVEKSRVLEKLLPGDVVLADGEFGISETVGMNRARSHIPAFTTSRTQAEDTRTIANVRMHVERVTGLVRRNYRILEGILPMDVLRKRSGDPEAKIDHIVKVCCGLTNLCPSVVSQYE